MGKEGKICLLGVLTCLCVTILCIIQFSTMKKVDLNLVALKKSKVNRQIAEDEIFFEGRYFV